MLDKMQQSTYQKAMIVSARRHNSNSQSTTKRRFRGSYCQFPDRREGGLEAQVCFFLCRNKVPHIHHPASHPVRLPGGKLIACTPDIEIAGWYIEPHGRLYFSDNFLEKWRSFRLQYPSKKTMLVTDDYAIPAVPPGVFDTIVSVSNFKTLFR